eukprot:6360437-Amphidinium_carterae.1
MKILVLVCDGASVDVDQVESQQCGLQSLQARLNREREIYEQYEALPSNGSVETRVFLSSEVFEHFPQNAHIVSSYCSGMSKVDSKLLKHGW